MSQICLPQDTSLYRTLHQVPKMSMYNRGVSLYKQFLMQTNNSNLLQSIYMYSLFMHQLEYIQSSLHPMCPLLPHCWLNSFLPLTEPVELSGAVDESHNSVASGRLHKWPEPGEMVQQLGGEEEGRRNRDQHGPSQCTDSLSAPSWDESY